MDLNGSVHKCTGPDLPGEQSGVGNPGFLELSLLSPRIFTAGNLEPGAGAGNQTQVLGYTS